MFIFLLCSAFVAVTSCFLVVFSLFCNDKYNQPDPGVYVIYWIAFAAFSAWGFYQAYFLMPMVSHIVGYFVAGLALAGIWTYVELCRRYAIMVEEKSNNRTCNRDKLYTIENEKRVVKHNLKNPL